MENVQQKDTLLLFPDANDFLCKQAEKHSRISVYSALRGNKNLFLRCLRKIHLYSNLPFKSIWFPQWKKQIYKYKYIIFHASRLTAEIAKYIKRCNSNTRIIAWYWNPVSKSTHPKEIPDELCEKWSFDQEDCKQYGMHYNTQYYFSQLALPNTEILYDAFFVGQDKGRVNKLLEVRKVFEELNLSVHFYIVRSKDSKKYQNITYEKPVSYERVLEFIAKSRVILDIVQDGQFGLTLRPLESIFYSKKLITNNKNIVEWDCYNRNNVFIWGQDDPDRLVEFVKTPFVPIDMDIIMQYSFENWVERFFYTYPKV